MWSTSKDDVKHASQNTKCNSLSFYKIANLVGTLPTPILKINIMTFGHRHVVLSWDESGLPI